jgi:hypothetical protein
MQVMQLPLSALRLLMQLPLQFRNLQLYHLLI